jgi:hypothetical protein
MTWGELESAAPELARLGRQRLEQAGIALLGTLRRDGSPRINPVEPHVAQGHLLFAAMAGSTKARDLARDPRCTLHSTVSDPDGSEGEFKLYGRADEIRARELRNAAPDAWWVAHPPEKAHVFSLAVDEAAFVSWDIERGEMNVRRWSRERGPGELTRRYP